MSLTAFEINERLDLLHQLKLFQTASLASLTAIAQAARTQSYHTGELIIEQGQLGNAFYIIKSGRVVVWQKKSELEELVNEHGPGDYIGEAALLNYTVRNATCSALTAVMTLVWDEAEFRRLIQPYFELEANSERTQRNLSSLQQMSSFDDLNTTHLIQLARLAYPTEYKRGDIVIAAGQQGRYFFIVESGQFEILPAASSANVAASTRIRGQFFGDITMLRDMPFSASVLTLSDGTLLRIEQDEHYRKVLKNPVLRRILLRLARSFSTIS